jgi:hypothetical protein
MRSHGRFHLALLSGLLTAGFLSGPAVAQNAASSGRWSVYADSKGTRIPYPADVFSVDRGRGENGAGQVFATRDGRAHIHMFSLPNPKGETPASYLRKTFRAQRSILTYDHVTPKFFAISMRQKGLIGYMRCNFSSNAGGTLHCVDLRYPEREKLAWDGIVTRISHSVRPL